MSLTQNQLPPKRSQRRLLNKDDRLRIKAVDQAIQFMNGRSVADLDKTSKQFKTVYEEIYNFLTNKPYRNG